MVHILAPQGPANSISKGVTISARRLAEMVHVSWLRHKAQPEYQGCGLFTVDIGNDLPLPLVTFHWPVDPNQDQGLTS